MKKILILLIVLCPTISFALSIDEAGTGGRRKPTLSLEISLSNPSEVENSLKIFMDSALPTRIQSIVFTGDLDGDGIMDQVSLPAFASKKGYDYYQAQSSMSVTKISCCQTTKPIETKFKVMGDSEALGIESDLGELSLVDTSLLTLSRRPGRAKFNNIVMRVVNPPEGLFNTARKGWDGTIKGSVNISTDEGKITSIPVVGKLSGVELSFKEFSPAEDQLKNNPRH